MKKIKAYAHRSLIDSLVAAARTGQAVAGWVTVTDLLQAVPIH